jgi:hypothetical protein
MVVGSDCKVKHSHTGIYFNRSTLQWEAWAVNLNREEFLLGCLSVEVVEEYPAAYQMWSDRVWGTLTESLKG